MPRRVFIFLKKTGNSVSYLPHRQLRKEQHSSHILQKRYLPHRQLRKIYPEVQRDESGYLPHRQLRKSTKQAS